MAITQADAGGTGALPFSGAGGTFTMATACAPNDLIISSVQLLNATANGAVSISDNVNSGNYTQIGANYFDGTGQALAGLFFKVCTGTGTPTLTVPSILSVGSGAGGKLAAMRFTGFTVVPSLDVLQVGQTTGTVNPTGSGVLNTTANPELMIVLESGTNLFAPGPGPGVWTRSGTASGQGAYLWWNIVASAPPVLETFSDIAGTVTAWGVTSTGFIGVPSGGGGGTLKGPVGGMFGIGNMGHRQ